MENTKESVICGKVYRINSRGTNADIKINPDVEVLKQAGFKYYDTTKHGYPEKWEIPPYWGYHKYLGDEMSFKIERITAAIPDALASWV